jgi:hypothetical protein
MPNKAFRLATPLDVKLPSPSALGEGLGVRELVGMAGLEARAFTGEHL